MLAEYIDWLEQQLVIVHMARVGSGIENRNQAGLANPGSRVRNAYRLLKDVEAIEKPVCPEIFFQPTRVTVLEEEGELLRLRTWADNNLAEATDGNGMTLPTASPPAARDKPSQENQASGSEVMLLPPGGGIVVKPGGFGYRGKEHPLSGKPMAMLKEFIRANDGTMTASQLLDKVWAGTAVNLETVRSAAMVLRKALRRAIMAARLTSTKDPPRCVDRGSALAWKLEMP